MKVEHLQGKQTTTSTRATSALEHCHGLLPGYGSTKAPHGSSGCKSCKPSDAQQMIESKC